MNSDSAVARRTTARVARRILPFLLILYIVGFLDRVNVAYAGLEMTQDLGFSDQVFGFGAGVFFLGYVLLAIPGALLVERWSARILISGLLACWGFVTTLTSLVHTPTQFITLRLLLGVAEAGFFPGVIVYLTHWFPARDRAKAIAGFMIGIPIASIVGSPLAGLILRVHWFGLNGWRWLFILEGVPAILLGTATYFYLTDRPQEARWLREDEREWLADTLNEEARIKRTSAPASIGRVLLDARVIMLGGVYLFGDVGLYGFTIWFPTILKRVSGYSTFTVTLVAIFPYLVALLSDLAVGWHSDKTGERRWHTALPLFVGAGILFVGLAFNLSLPVQIIFFLRFGRMPTQLATLLLVVADGSARRNRSRSVRRLHKFSWSPWCIHRSFFDRLFAHALSRVCSGLGGTADQLAFCRSTGALDQEHGANASLRD
jgi:ACS family tartrate transporter-like MFS transporter